MIDIEAAVKHHYASESVILYCLYMYFFLGVSIKCLATNFAKHRRTIKRWIGDYEKGRGVGRKVSHEAIFLRKFRNEQLEWVVELIDDVPLLLIDEIQKRFNNKWDKTISISYVQYVLSSRGHPKKTVERTSMAV